MPMAPGVRVCHVLRPCSTRDSHEYNQKCIINSFVLFKLMFRSGSDVRLYSNVMSSRYYFTTTRFGATNTVGGGVSKQTTCLPESNVPLHCTRSKCTQLSTTTNHIVVSTSPPIVFMIVLYLRGVPRAGSSGRKKRVIRGHSSLGAIRCPVGMISLLLDGVCRWREKKTHTHTRPQTMVCKYI